MKFINYLKTIDSVTIYPLVTLALFILFFFVVVLWVSKANKNYIDNAKNIPLND
jgi:cbb3-type cytochrome oxidase subunit 3